MGKVLVKYRHAILVLVLLGLYIWSWHMYWDNIFTAAGIK
jgi:hypothetical protein